MAKKKINLKEQQKQKDLRNYWVTAVILLVIFTAGLFKSGIVGRMVYGLERYLFGDVYGFVILLWFGWNALNAWHLYKDESKESRWPLIFLASAALLFVTYVDAEDAGFTFFTEHWGSFKDFFTGEIPVRAGGGLIGGLLYGLFSVGLGRNFILLIICIFLISSFYIISRSETFSPYINSATGNVKAFVKRPERPVEEAKPQDDYDEPKPVPNLWKMGSDFKTKTKELASSIGKIVVTEPEDTEPEIQLISEVKEEVPDPGLRRMVNISADGPTEEIMLVSIPGKTVSSRKSIFINIEDLLEDPEPVKRAKMERGMMQEEYEPEVEEYEDIPVYEPEIPEPEPEVIPPVQQKLPLGMSLAQTNERAAQAKPASRRRSRTADKEAPYRLPSSELLDKIPAKSRNSANEIEAREKGELLIQILRNFDIDSQLIDTHIGPAVTQFEIRPDANVKISRINSLTDNIKMQLAAKDIRIEAPIPGRNAIGIEIPNAETTPVKMRELIGNLSEKEKKSPLLFFLGKDLLGRTISCRLDKMPHLLIAGATGSGKSVCMNAIITSLLLRTDPDKVKMLLVDPKKVEFTPYKDIPHLLGPVINDPNQANNALKVIVQRMDERYNMFAAAGVRNIEGYNAKVIAQDGKPNEDGSPAPKYMPYIVVIIDELADLMLVAGKEVEGSIQRITQLARAAGIHLIVATQRPSVNVITGVIKANIPSRIAFSVSSAIDSRTILDSHGAERLLGNGDMLYLPMGTNAPTRVQGVFVTDDEVLRITEAVSAQKKPHYDDAFVLLEGIDGSEGSAICGVTEDPMFEEVKDYVIEAQKASTSLLQRRFGIGYNRAARMIDALEQNGIIGPAQGSKPRDVYIKPETRKNTTETGGTY